MRETYSVVVLVEVLCDHWLMSRECLLEIGKGIARDAKCRCLDVMWIAVEPKGNGLADSYCIKKAPTCLNRATALQVAHVEAFLSESFPCSRPPLRSRSRTVWQTRSRALRSDIQLLATECQFVGAKDC